MNSSPSCVPPSVLHEFFSYLFHEIISPVSSLLTGIDLLEAEQAYSQELVDILKNSSQTLRARLEYFRAALGGGGLALSLLQVQELMKKMWGAESNPPVIFSTTGEIFPRGVGQKALVLALCLAQRKKWGDPPSQLIYGQGAFSANLGESLMSYEELIPYLKKSDASNLLKADPSTFLLEILQSFDS
jgi:hypothetical protein